jgi:acyl-CoA synthetase (AMP-forming)/AMP-acid ligase II
VSTISAPSTSVGGTVDLVPRSLRRAWSMAGRYPDRDVYGLFARRCAEHPAKAAVIDTDGTTNYVELDDQARRLAVGLSHLGVGPGDVVGVQLPNIRLACAVDLACAALGAVVLPFPVSRGQRDAQSLLSRSGAVVVITVAGYGGIPVAERLRDLATGLPELRAVVAGPSIGDGPTEDTVPRGCVPLDALLAADPDDLSPPDTDPDGPVRILVTSGSEAEPKMVLYSHNALTGGRGAMLTALDDDPPSMRNFYLVPLASAFGSTATAVTLARLGATVVLRDRFDGAAALRTIEGHRATHLLGVPTMERMLAQHPHRPGSDLGSLRSFVVGGSPLDAATARAGLTSLGCTVVNLYGSADGVQCYHVVRSVAALGGVRTVPVGRPDPAVTDIRVLDETDRDLPAGGIGDIVARGPMSPLCYVGAPELNGRYRTPEGWVRTGDLGRFDDQGCLSVVGRRRDVIIRGGLNISPAELESVLIEHPQISDVACVPVSDPVLGECACACVASQAPLALEDVTAFLADQGLDRHKWPEQLLVLARLPLGAAGKIDRPALRRLAEPTPTTPVVPDP